MTVLMQAEGLRKYFYKGGGIFGEKATTIHAVEDVSITIPAQASVGLVGESGCGKSTVARLILRLIEADSGTVDFAGHDLQKVGSREMRRLRRRIQLIFQDPYASLNARRTIRQTLQEPLRVHSMCGRAERRERAEAILAEVGLPKDSIDRLPSEFSGGQRQRIGIARALILEPQLVVADEPVSALDVSVQAQILQLLNKLQQQRNLSFLFVTHDLGVVRYFCTATLVMYMGRVVESGPTEAIMNRPAHPYTVLLRESSPVPDPCASTGAAQVDVEMPSPAAPPPGCPFHTRCSHAMSVCREVLPKLRALEPDRKVACHLF